MRYDEISNILVQVCQYIQEREDVRPFSHNTPGKELFSRVLEVINHLGTVRRVDGELEQIRKDYQGREDRIRYAATGLAVLAKAAAHFHLAVPPLPPPDGTSPRGYADRENPWEAWALDARNAAAGLAQVVGGAAMDPADEFLAEVRAELRRAREKFPSSEGSICAAGEEYGELCKAYLDEPRDRVRKEAVQLATMAARVALEGDPTLDPYREKRGADHGQ